MNITAIKAALSSKSNIDKIRQAIYNTSKLGWNCDHVRSHRTGKNFLAVRVRDGKLGITDRKGKDVTQIVVNVARGLV